MAVELTRRERDTLRSVRICREGGNLEPDGNDLANVMGCHKASVYMTLVRLRRKGYMNPDYRGVVLSKVGEKWIKFDKGGLELGGKQFYGVGLMTLTEKQKAIVDYMAKSFRETMLIPSYSEIAEEFDINISGVGHHIKSIIKKGWLKQLPGRHIMFTDVSKVEYGLFVSKSIASILEGEIVKMSPKKGDVIFIKVPDDLMKSMSVSREQLQRDFAPSGVDVIVIREDVKVAMKSYKEAKQITRKIRQS